MRLWLAILAAGLLTACGSPDPEVTTDASELEEPAGLDTSEFEGAVPQGPVAATLEGAINAPWRSTAARARDPWRHPAETLEFFDLDPSGTVLEIWPGGGWYSDILAPWLTANGGTYVAGWPPIEPGNADAVTFRDRFLARFNGEEVAQVVMAEAGPTGIILPEGVRPDAIVTFRNVHSFMGRGVGEAMFAAFYDTLPPGGVLGVVQHRLPADRVQDPRAGTGYVQEEIVRALAEEAGFEFVASSEINANPADDADHPFGVWTLAPIRRSSEFGAPADPEFDRTAFDAIGESDRMTLKFVKPLDPALVQETEAAPQ